LRVPPQKNQLYSMSQVCSCVVATGPGNGGNSSKQQASAPNNHAESDGCSCRHSGWDKCWYPPFFGEESKENVTPGAEWQTEREEAQGCSRPGSRARNHSPSQREGIDKGSPVGRLTSKELEILLWWKGVGASKMGNVANSQLLYQQLAKGDLEEVSIPAPWTKIDKVELIALRDAPIKIRRMGG
jgi:hypothetical protein